MHAFLISLVFWLLAQAVCSDSGTNYCDGYWVDHLSAKDLFMNYTLHGARTSFAYNDPKKSMLDFVQDACPAQVARFSCYMRSDDLQRSQKQDEIHFVPFDRKTCLPFTPSSFLRRIRNRRVFFLGDSVTGQLWSSFACALYKAEENHLYVAHWDIPVACRRASQQCPIAPNPYEDNKPNPQNAHVRGGFIRFRESNASLSFLAHHRVHELPFGEQIARQRLTSDDIVVTAFGLHYDVESVFRSELQWMANWIGKQTSPPQFLVLHPTPQHFNIPNGYHNAQSDSGDPNEPRCFPLQGWNDSIAVGTAETETIKAKRDMSLYWRSTALEEIFEPLVKQKKAFIVPITMGLNGRHDAHLGWGDCTHWCYPGNAFKYMHLMIFNALRRVLPHDEARKHEEPPLNKMDMSFKLHPTLQTGALVQFKREKSIHFADNGMLREFQSWDAFVTHGFDLSNVIVLERHEQGPVEVGEPITVDTKLPLETL